MAATGIGGAEGTRRVGIAWLRGIGGPIERDEELPREVIETCLSRRPRGRLAGGIAELCGKAIARRLIFDRRGADVAGAQVPARPGRVVLGRAQTRAVDEVALIERQAVLAEGILLIESRADVLPV